MFEVGSGGVTYPKKMMYIYYIWSALLSYFFLPHNAGKSGGCQFWVGLLCIYYFMETYSRIFVGIPMLRLDQTYPVAQSWQCLKEGTHSHQWLNPIKLEKSVRTREEHGILLNCAALIYLCIQRTLEVSPNVNPWLLIYLEYSVVTHCSIPSSSHLVAPMSYL